MAGCSSLSSCRVCATAPHRDFCGSVVDVSKQGEAMSMTSIVQMIRLSIVQTMSQIKFRQEQIKFRQDDDVTM